MTTTATKTAKHPILDYSITHDPVPHTYRDSDGDLYTSVTTFVKRFFVPFDADAEADRMASETGRDKDEILTAWKKKRDDAAESGNRVHAYAEAVVMGTAQPAPETDYEKRAFAMVDKALASLSKQYEILGAEQIVFDPLWDIAGMIDLPARNRKTGALAILDWKTCESITNDNYGRMGLPPIDHVPDSKQAHYMMQLSTYGWLLTDREYSSYPSAGEPVECAMIHLPHIGVDPVWRPVPYQGEDVLRMIRSFDDKASDEATTRRAG